MNLIRAENHARDLIKQLEPFCDRIEVVGNIRRRKQDIKTIDLLLVPKSSTLFEFMGKLTELGCVDGVRVSNSKTLLIKDEFEDIEAKLWFAIIESWPIMFFVKTGGRKSIERISNLCEKSKWHLSIKDGAIFDVLGKRLPIKEEADIFTFLNIQYIEPAWRE